MLLKLNAASEDITTQIDVHGKETMRHKEGVGLDGLGRRAGVGG